jgi:hypothetical protein
MLATVKGVLQYTQSLPFVAKMKLDNMPAPEGLIIKTFLSPDLLKTHSNSEYNAAKFSGSSAYQAHDDSVVLIWSKDICYTPPGQAKSKLPHRIFGAPP